LKISIFAQLNRFFYSALLSASSGIFAAESKPPVTKEPKVLDWTVVRTIDHDANAFTQGLVYEPGDQLSESIGRYGKSEIRRIDLKTGKTIASEALPKNLFGEGLAKIKDTYYQLTWREGQYLEWQYRGKKWIQKKVGTLKEEGWGLAASNNALYLSDGSDRIFKKNPSTFETQSTLNVKSGNVKFERLNELEWVDGQLFANIWQSQIVLRIDPNSGDVTGLMDLSKLVPSHPTDPDAVLNGLAWDPHARILYVTGKLWPKIYGLKISKK
jgi:glutaminyl-peptide cyclotransferase